MDTMSDEIRWSEMLQKLDEKNLRRTLRLAGSEGGDLVNMASNDYLGLADDPRLVEAAQRAAEQYGVGAGASRLVCGHTSPHAELEARIADYKQTEAALVFTSGYAANVGVLTALIGPRDAIFADRLNHASLIDGARQSRALVRIFRHGDLEHLEHLLETTDVRGRRYLITDGVFSMDGELAPLPDLAELAERYDATLIVDDAHGTGVVGPDGRGTVAHFGCHDRVPVQIGTLSKALGVQGGFVAGSQALIDLMINRARSFVFSTGIAPMLCAAASEAVEIARTDLARREQLQRHLRRLGDGLRERGYEVVGEAPAPMLAVVLGEPEAALRQSDALREAGVLAPAIRPPTVPDGTSRIRLAPKATYSEDAITRVLAAFPTIRR